MIQRIQTLYLLLTALLAVLFLTGNIFTFPSAEGNDLILKITGTYTRAGESGIEKTDSSSILSFILLLIPVISVVTIFFFKNRRLQLKLNIVVVSLILIFIILSVIKVFAVSREFNVTLSPGLKLALPFIMLISAALAYRSIKKDEELVRSYDRLR